MNKYLPAIWGMICGLNLFSSMMHIMSGNTVTGLMYVVATICAGGAAVVWSHSNLS